MIAFLEGIVHSVSTSSVVVIVNGIGYEVFMVERNLRNNVINEQQPTSLFIYHHIRENTAELYGFLEQEEKQMFLHLISVSGIGPKVALTILNTASVDLLHEAVTSQDKRLLEKVSGIGAKKAEKILLELKDKLGSAIRTTKGAPQVDGDVIDALEQLGYTRTNIQKALREIPPECVEAQDKINAVLKYLGS